MKNIDIDEWMINNNLNGLDEIENQNGEMIFIHDLLEKHLKEQLAIHKTDNKRVIEELEKISADEFKSDSNVPMFERVQKRIKELKQD